MKKSKMIILTTTTTIAIASLIAIGVNKDFSSFRIFGYNSDEVECERYFNYENGYTSIYEIVENLNSGIENSPYKTWGTVTKFFLGSNNYKNFYIQSTDKYGQIAGILVYNSPIALEEGNVITITGSPILYDNLPEFLNPSIGDITIDYTTNNYPVKTLETSSPFWENSDVPYSNQFINAQTMGARKVSIDNVHLEYVSSGNGRAYFDDGTIVTLYFKSVKNTTAINSHLSILGGQQAKIIGILHSRKVGVTAQLTLLIRDTSDIVPLGGSTGDDQLSFDVDNTFIPGSYSTGNYGNAYLSGYKFEYYRTVSSSYGFVDILPNFENNASTSPGAFYNNDPIVGITNISITYQTSYSTGVLPLLEFGADNLDNNVMLPLSTTSKTMSYEIDSVIHFVLISSRVMGPSTKGPTPATPVSL